MNENYKAFEKVIGYTDVIAVLNRLCDSMCRPEKYRALGVTTPHGLLLHGVPGVGKTLMAHCLIEASGRQVFTCRKDLPNGDFIREIKDVFKSAKENAPSIVFLDDMDKFSNDDRRYRNAEEFVTVQSCVDDCREAEVFVLATANGLDNIPSSLLRAGRFDKVIEIKPPEGEDAEKIVAHFLRGKHCSDDIDAAEVAHILVEKSCADLETVINEAGIYAAYEGRDTIGMDDVVRACMCVLYNAPEVSAAVPASQATCIAYHEAGHALLSELLNPGSVNFVSISAHTRGTCGLTVTTKPEEYFFSKRQMENRVIAILGGKAASEVVFGEVDTGANSDLHRAFDIVERFVDHYCSYGFDKWEQSRSSSNDLLSRRENQMAADVQRYYEQAKTLIRENRAKLDAVAAALVQQKTLLGGQLRRLFAQ